MSETWESVSKEKLLDFVREYARRDEVFANALRVQFDQPVTRKDVSRIRDRFKERLEAAFHDRFRQRWTPRSLQTGEIFHEIDERTAQGHFRMAFESLSAVYKELLEYFDVQEECEVSDEVEYCLTKMADVARRISDPTDQVFVYDTCIELANLQTGRDYGASYEDKLLAIAVDFLTSDNRASFDRLLGIFKDSYRRDSFMPIHLRAVHKLDGEAAAQAFVDQNLDSEPIRLIAFERAMTAKNYSEAERICRIVTDAPDHQTFAANRYWGLGQPWEERLYSVYQKSKDRENQIILAEKLLLFGKIEYYAILKQLLKRAGRWTSTYPVLLAKCGEQLDYGNYMQILKAERENETLMRQVEAHPDTIYQYGKGLLPEYRERVKAVFVTRLDGETQSARDRRDYASVCRSLAKFGALGFSQEAKALADKYRLVHKRRHAFIDELNKAKL